jgi:hypothetical protein
MSDSSVEGYVRGITIIAALGGFLFGYDTELQRQAAS